MSLSSGFHFSCHCSSRRWSSATTSSSGAARPLTTSASACSTPSHNRPTQQDHRDLRAQDQQALSGQAANRDRRHEPAQSGDSQPLWQRLHQAVRPRPPDATHRGGEQQCQRLRRQQIGGKSATSPQCPCGDQRQLPQRTTGHSGNLHRSRPSESLRNQLSRRPESASPASSSTTRGNSP